MVFCPGFVVAEFFCGVSSSVAIGMGDRFIDGHFVIFCPGAFVEAVGDYSAPCFGVSCEVFEDDEVSDSSGEECDSTTDEPFLPTDFFVNIEYPDANGYRDKS